MTGLRHSALAVLLLTFCGPVSGADLLLHDDFESYDPGPVELHGASNVNTRWFAFSGSGLGVAFERSARIVERVGVNDSRAIVLEASLDKANGQHFFVGVRHVFTADLSTVPLERLRLRALARVDVEGETRRGHRVFPQDVTYAFRLESLHARRRGMRQFDETGSGRYLPIGGRLSDAISGLELNQRDLKFARGEQRYQIVLVMSTSLGAGFRRGNYAVRLYVDELYLEIVDEDRPQEPPARFSMDRCTTR